ncbi:3-methyladenine DNA glycosylase [Pseudomonas sp. ArH3a]|uniref:3-methyladenine DNA glycosylase n=1 Tax=Pseudomonas sp. ArH3a TaxID=2862945 RepID=UPI001F5857E1|nr:3-methyladenine DNA glycosylase [Pseudomonas sp. ArH3a]UNM22115.1 3-methyladenine DNA glycosylase [Pseudomonas sp. ArH3a]
MPVRELGKKFKNQTINGVVNAITVLISPADNVNGIILRSFYGVGTMAFGPKVPTAKDMDDRALQEVVPTILTYNDLAVPAGLGVYLYNIQNYVLPTKLSWDSLNADGTVA